MPRYKVKASDGKVLTIEAPDESALDEAMSDYEAQAGQQSTPVSAASDDPMASEGMAQASAASKMLPQLKTAAERLTPLGSVNEIAGQLTGDRPSSGLRAGMAAADIASLGLAGKVKAAGQAASMGASGIKQALASGAGGGAAGMAAEGMGANPMMSFLASILGGGAGGSMAGAKLAPKAAPSPVLAELESLGAKPTAAMRSGGSVAKAMDLSARTNPLLPMLTNKIGQADESMAEATQRMAQNRFGTDPNLPRAEEAGATMKGALKAVAKKRSDAYAPALEKLKTAPGFGNFQKNLAKAAEATAGDVSTVSYESFQKALRQELKGKTTPAQLDKALSSVKARFKKELGAGMMDAQTSRDFNEMMGAVKDEFYKGLDNLSASKPGDEGALGKQLREAKGDYAAATGGMEPLVKALASRKGKPEAIAQSVLASGSAGVKGLLGQADDATRQTLQREMALSIMQEAIGKGGKVSGDKLASLVGTKYREIVPLLGDQAKNLQDMAEAMRISGASDLGAVNPSGSGTSLMRSGHVAGVGAGLLDPSILSALAAKTGLDLGYAVAGPKIQAGAAQLGRVPGLPFAAGAMGAQRQSKDQEALERARRFSQLGASR